MKKSFFLLAAFFLFSNSIFGQEIYLEQNSGVSSNLTSASIAGSYSPIQVWVCGDGGVVLKTTNLGDNWLSAGNGGIPSNVNLVTISSKALDTALTAGNIGTTSFVYRTANGGTNWTQVFSQANGHINAIWMSNGLQGYMVGNPVGGRWSLWKTINGGVNWDSSGLYIPQSGNETGWNNSLFVLYTSIWFGTSNSRIYKSSNNGVSWSFVSTSPEVNSTAVWLFADTTYYSYAIFGGNNAYYTTSGGINWTRMSFPDTVSGQFVGFDGAFFGVRDMTPEGTYAVRNFTKIYFINYAEYTAPSGIYNNVAYALVSNGGSGILFTWAVRTNGGITRISLFRGGEVRRVSSQIPESYSLGQNYPNPFNPTTTIRFFVPLLSKGGVSRSDGVVKLTVYDVLGRAVTVLVNQQLTPGVYETLFDASKIASGIYYYQLEVGAFSQTKKMVVLK